jgi:hypothetical protein
MLVAIAFAILAAAFCIAPLEIAAAIVVALM